jgi:hypothetical protein
MSTDSQVSRPNKRFLLVAIVVAIIAGLSSSFALNFFQSRNSAEEGKLRGEVAMSAPELEGLVKKKNLEIYWAGPRPGYAYTVDTSNKGTHLLRYIKLKVKPSDVVSNSRVIATYKSKNAFADSVAAAERPENTGFRNPDGSVVFYQTAKNTSVYLAFPKKKVQIEIYDPIVGQALSLAILQDQITKVGQ